MFHRFHENASDYPLQGSLSAADFERILLFVGLDNILVPDEWLSRLQAGTLGPLDLCLTFDDGLRSQLDFAQPVLAKYGLRAFWFVYSSVFEGGVVKSEVYSHAAAHMGGMAVLAKTMLNQFPADLRSQLNTPEFLRYQGKMLQLFPFYTAQDCQFRFLRNSAEHQEVFETLMDHVMEAQGLNPKQISKQLWMDEEHLKFLLKAGHWIGLHSYSHPYAVGVLSYSEQEAEYQRNYDHLASLTGCKPRSVSHPLNSYNSTTLQILTALGIECGFCSNMSGSSGINRAENRLLMAREDSTTLLTLAK